jgi:hypothetical protein
MSAASVLARGRAAALALMVDACTIQRLTSSTTDPVTGVPTPTYATIYAGRCRVQQQTATAGARDVGEANLLLLRLEMQLPMSVTGLQVDDVVTVTASALDPDLIGRRFRIRDLAHKTHATSRRVGVEEVTS